MDYLLQSPGLTTPVVFYDPRTYRDFNPSGRFCVFRVVVETSDLYVKALVRLEKETYALVTECRSLIKDAISRRPEFLTSLTPIEEDSADSPVALQMVRAGKKAGVGPMASVAGAVAEYVGRRLLKLSPELIIENGGDIFFSVSEPVVAGVIAGRSAFSGRLGIKAGPTAIPLGICTSSATVGPSLSRGKADAATVISRDVALADAVATALGNRISRANDLKRAVEWAVGVPGVDAALAILGDKAAAVGNVELVPIAESGKEIGR
jgi:hypothetical protein